MESQKVVSMFNETLIDMLNNFGSNYPSVNKYKRIVEFSYDSPRWIQYFKEYSREEMSESLGMSEEDLSEHELKIFEKYMSVLGIISDNYIIGK